MNTVAIAAGVEFMHYADVNWLHVPVFFCQNVSLHNT